MKTMLLTLHIRCWTKSSGGLASVLLAAICFFTPASRAQEIEDSGGQEICFQKTQWTAPENVRLQVETYRGHKSLSIRGTTTSIAQVEDVVFSSGRIEFDLAFAGRIPPWICFGVKGETEADMVTMNPWPSHESLGNTRLFRAILTKRQRNFLVLNYRQSSETFDANRWVHVRIDVCEKRCRIFIDDDRTPAIELDNPLAGGTVGIQGNCYIRNLKIDEREDPVTPGREKGGEPQ